MHKIKLKALSVNKAFRGRKFKTEEYKGYEYDLNILLPKIKVPKSEKYKVFYVFGLSSKNADGDNCIKQFQDIISKKYGFNDKKIYKWDVEKVDTKKGSEFIKFKIIKWKQKTTK